MTAGLLALIFAAAPIAPHSHADMELICAVIQFCLAAAFLGLWLEAPDYPSGELFGFERTAVLSAQSAEQIAQAAAQFGQEDDITVLTISRAAAGGLSAP